MQWNTDEIDAARATLQTVNEAVDAITSKAAQLESLLVVLAHSAGSDDLPAVHRQNLCLLGAELAAEIRAAAGRLS
jgi:hypothetical protein